MIKKIKEQENKKYTTISLYVIGTVFIIFTLAFITARINIILGSTIGVLKYVGNLLTPVIIAVVIAYIMDPMVAYFDKNLRKIKFLKFKKEGKYRTIAVFSSILLIIFTVFFLLWLFIFSITQQISNIGIDEIVNLVVNYINSFSDSLKGIEQKLAEWNIESKSLESYITQFSTTLINGLKNFTNNLATYTMNISGSISNFILGLIIAIYLLLDKEDFILYGNKFSRALFSEGTESKIKSYWKDFDRIFSGYIRGQILDSLFMCVTLSLVLSIIGIKFGALIGIFAGLCNLIPFFGPIVAYVGTILFGVLNAQYNQVLIAIVALLIVQQIDGSIVGPKLLGHSVSLKPVFILITVIIGGSVGGLLGMVLAVPIAGLLKLFIKRYIDERLEKKELIKQEELLEKEYER
jgi:predicted PurR-regulated permease PerM